MAIVSARQKKRILVCVAVVAVAFVGWSVWSRQGEHGPGDGFVSGNGRIEATEIDIATKLAGRVSDVLVREGDFVKTGDSLARMQIVTLEAQLAEAVASQRDSVTAVAASKATVSLRQSDVAAAKAQVAQREAELDAAQRRLARTETLARAGAMSMQELDDDRARTRSAEAAVMAAQAQVVAARAAVAAAQAQQTGAESRAIAAQATVDRVAADIADSELKAPRDGRVQFRVAQPGEVLAAGGRVLNMVDLTDVYMTFFVPDSVAGRIALGSDVRVIVDAAPGFVIPAKVSFVASTAQFTPKTVETASERQKLMFRVRAQIDPALLREHIDMVKTGLPGVAWLKIDPAKDWPPTLQVKVRQ